MKKIYLKKATMIFSFICLFSTTAFQQEPHIFFTSRITGLSIPVQVVNAGDGTNRLFVVCQGSSNRASIIVYDQNFVKLDTFLRVPNITTGGEQGLLSMAFHPEYENAASPFFGMFYIYYTNSNGDLQIARYAVSADPDQADPLSKDTVLTIPHPTNGNHNGGTILFGPDGYLYLATGDGGGSGDTPMNAQNPGVLLGKLLRLDATSSATAPFYTIPPTNPYVGVTAPDTLDAIYSIGLRNPFRWSFDRATNDVWIADVGQGSWEEINFQTAALSAGSNYGWRCYEGNASFNMTGCTGPISKYVFPVHVYPNPGGAAVTGGVVYRGTVPANSSLVGYYIAADYYSGTLYKIGPNGVGGWTVYPQAGTASVAHFGETESGEILAVSQFPNNAVYSVNVDFVLPVALETFTATVMNREVQLNWKTQSEQDVEKFNIEFSTDGINFSEAGTTPALNNSNGGNYTFTHVPGITGRVFYRLKTVDFNNGFDYSNTLSVQLSKPGKNFVSPSVVTTGQINVFPEGDFNTLELINMNGAVLLKQNISGRTGRIDIAVPFVTTGTYIVQLRNNQTTVKQRILIRQ